MNESGGIVTQDPSPAWISNPGADVVALDHPAGWHDGTEDDPGRVAELSRRQTEHRRVLLVASHQLVLAQEHPEAVQAVSRAGNRSSPGSVPSL